MIFRQPKKAAESSYDLVVVGGGVYGAMLILEAARRGLKPLLLEKSDFGGATTWNSLRIIHGGLRYLQTLDLRRFLESVQERKWFLQHFPDLVEPLSCSMPLYGKGLKRRFVLRLALLVNDRLSRTRNAGVPPKQAILRGKVLDAAETISLFPAVNKKDLVGAVLWWDAVMRNSQRLLIEILRWASKNGAKSLNYVEAKRPLVEGDTIVGLQALDRLSGTTLEYRAPVIVNCSGPWCRQVAETFDRDISGLFHSSLAFNVLLDREPLSTAALAVSPKCRRARTYFLLPWRNKIFAGTYHLPWTGEINQAGPNQEQLNCFLSDLNSAIPGFEVQGKDVAQVYPGLLPAVAEGSERLAVREIIYDHGTQGGPSGLFSVSGVKFTTARSVAEKTMEMICARQGKQLPQPSQTERPLAVPSLNLTEFNQLYSSNAGAAAAYLRRLVDEESVVYLDDLLLRRTDWRMDPKESKTAVRKVRELLGWSESNRLLPQSPLRSCG